MASDMALKRSAKGPKRRNERNALTFYEKIAVIRHYEETQISRNSLAKMFHCCATQIRRILDHKEELLQQLATLSEADASIIIEEMTRKRRKFEMSAISFILHQWVQRCRQLRLRRSITNQTLKETALKMAAILNLPAFRPSFRWLNRFRGKYKYNEQDLGAAQQADAVDGDLAVEDIIIEFKDALPSFMQKEISAITSSAKEEEKLMLTNITQANATLLPLYLNESSVEYELSVDDEEEAVKATRAVDSSNSNCTSPAASPNSNCEAAATTTDADLEVGASESELRMNAGTTALLGSIFPHLAIIHQFALLNADVKALELISQLGVHMQTQAAEGAYKQLTLAPPTDDGTERTHSTANGGVMFADIDDIELIDEE